MVELGLQ